jgi:hypothetical protein
MSRQALEAIVGRAILDAEFRLAFFADPDGTVLGYELTEEEMAALKQLDAESLDACGSSLSHRVAVVIHSSRKERGAAHGSIKEQTTSSG